MTMTNKKDNLYQGLYYEPTASSIERAKKRIQEERSGEQFGLYSRWEALNHLLLKYFRFSHVIAIAGMSGSGKSYFLNMLRQDFLDTVDIKYFNTSAFNLDEEPMPVYFNDKTLVTGLPNERYEANALYYPKARLISYDNYLVHKAINRECVHNVITIHFGFEMDAADELLRSASNILGKSYGFLMSSEWSKELKQYAKLTDMDYLSCEEVLESFSNRKEFYIPTSGNVKQIYNTVYDIVNRYPNHKIVVTIDHTLLSKKLDERSDGDLQSATALNCIDMRQDFEAMVIPLVQLNQNIENTERKLKPALQYPGKDDIHFGAQIWWACDDVIINHRPEILNIQQYGIDKLNTKHLFHSVVAKSRKGTLGNVWGIEDFKHGRIHSATKSHFKTNKITNEFSSGELLI